METLSASVPLSDVVDRARWRQLVVVSATQVLVLGLWFATSAVLPALRAEWGMGQGTATWLTNAVQLGFVAGAVLSAALNLADLVSCRILIATSAALGAVTTIAFVLVAHGPATAIPIRFLTGVALAGVYPPGIKVAASWFKSHRGLAVGVLVGGLTLGSGSPHAIAAVGNPSPRALLLVSAAFALVGGTIAILFLREGPYSQPAPRLEPSYVIRMFRDPSQRRVNFGYFGHMWELYAWWAWVPLFLAASWARWRGSPGSHAVVETTAFVAIGVAGALGAVLGGRIADDVGRARLIVVALTISGASCICSALVYGFNPLIVVGLLLVWGVAVIADSAQFSAALTELTDVRYTGTALTAQLAIGFLVTVGSIRLVPWLAGEIGWRYAFVPLALGPLLGIAAVAPLEPRP
ncbi:MAG TPA: MFS transporter [Gaiellaceae bacterium]|nr:MFS transporter [Gaiellaceae bacterium]